MLNDIYYADNLSTTVDTISNDKASLYTTESAGNDVGPWQCL